MPKPLLGLAVLAALAGCSKSPPVPETDDRITVAGADWPWWRGPTRDGVADPSQDVPLTWSEKENVLWKADVPGRGHGSPIVVGDQVMEVRDREHEPPSAGQLEWDPRRRSLVPELDPFRFARLELLADQDAVAVLGPACPSSDRAIVAGARGPQQPILLRRVDDLLEAHQVGLKRGHVGEQERQALIPAIGEVAQVERCDVQLVHGQPSSGTRGRAKEKVEPLPSVDSSQIRPPCCSTTCRAIARPRPVPPGVSPRTRARSTL